MQSLRDARFIARLVLAWFALSLGVALAAPVVSPQALALVCSGGGMKLLATGGEDGAAAAGGHGLDCPLCAHAVPPPTVARAGTAPADGLAHALAPRRVARIAGLTAAPPPARGPPAFP